MQATRVPGTIWIDLTPLDGQPQPCTMQLSLNDQGAIEEFDATLVGLSALVANRMLREASLIAGQETTGTLDDGRQFRATIGIISSIGFTDVAFSLRIRGQLSNILFSLAQRSQEVPVECV